MSAGFLDDVQISYCDSVTNRNIPKQDWMNNVGSDNPHYWEEETLTCLAKQETLKENIKIAKLRFNQTGGVHIYQHMYGCDWDNETGEVKGYDQTGYDGEDFIALDLNTSSWIAAKPEAVLTKHKWNNNKYALQYEKFYFTKVCVEWLKRYVRSGRRSLMKTDLPKVFLLQKTSSSPVSCLATGFYPDKAEIFWRKDGKEIHKGVETEEILPNNDGTFQMSAHIDLSSVAPEDWTQYECVFQLSGEKYLIKKADKVKIRTNETNHMNGSHVGVIPDKPIIWLQQPLLNYSLFSPQPGFWERQKSEDEETVKRTMAGHGNEENRLLNQQLPRSVSGAMLLQKLLSKF